MRMRDADGQGLGRVGQAMLGEDGKRKETGMRKGCPYFSRINLNKQMIGIARISMKKTVQNKICRIRPGFKHLIAISLLLLLTSCLPTFENGLPPNPNSLNDSRLPGMWINKENGVLKEQLVFNQRSDNWLNIIYIYDIPKSEDNGCLSVLGFEGYTTTVDNQPYICFRYPKTEKPSDNPFMIAKYNVKDRSLVLNLLSYDRVKELILSNKLKGKVEKEDILNGKPESVLVTADSSKIKMIVSTDKEIFGKKPYETMSFTRSDCTPMPATNMK
jgi:hypothetical protein